MALRTILVALCGLALAVPVARAQEDPDRLIALSEPLVAESLRPKGEALFTGVYLVTRPTHVPRRYMPDLPKAKVAVCGRVTSGPAPSHRFFATFADKAGKLDDSQADIAIEDNDPADLSQAALDRSARFMRGWRQYCEDAQHLE